MSAQCGASMCDQTLRSSVSREMMSSYDETAATAGSMLISSATTIFYNPISETLPAPFT